MTRQLGQTIGVLGATGVYGRHLIPRLAARGFRVRALVRRPEVAGVARACGAEVPRDIFDGARSPPRSRAARSASTSPRRFRARAAAATGPRTIACAARARRSG